MSISRILRLTVVLVGLTPGLAATAPPDPNTGNSALPQFKPGVIKPKPRIQITPEYLFKPSQKLKLNGIAGRITSLHPGSLLQGYQVEVRAYKETALSRGTPAGKRRLTLNAQGQANYIISGLAPGRYRVMVVKGAAASGPGPRANPCYRGTTPNSRLVRLTRERPYSPAQDFVVDYVLAWDQPRVCW